MISRQALNDTRCGQSLGTRVKTLLLLALLLVLLGACGRSPQVPEGSAAAAHDYVLRVELAPGDTVSEIERRYGGEVVVWLPEASFAILGLNETSELTTLNERNAQPNQVVTTPETAATASSAVWSSSFRSFSGGNSGSLAYAENSGAWAQIALPSAHTIAPNLGAGVKVAVIDTGLDLEHPAFKGRLAPKKEWYDFVDGDAVPQEVWLRKGSNAGYGHGTAVAGIVLQIAPNATILPLRVLGPDGSGLVTNVASAIDRAIKHGAQVINLSLGTDVDVTSLQSMIEHVASHGVYVVASSGNSGDQLVTFPAANADRGSGSTKYLAVGVGSVNVDDQRSSFSTHGDLLELVAPGESIYTPFPNSQEAQWSGTSMAAPIVAGALALALGEALPPASQRTELAKHINATARNISSQNPGVKLGYGRLDIERFLRKAFGD
jgi:thermitase